MILKLKTELTMEPEIRILTKKKLVGIHRTMSLTNNTTRDLWKEFMSRRREVQDVIGAELFSMQIYNAGYFEKFNPDSEFEKWAAVEVANDFSIPDGMESFVLGGGLFAVFLHTGSASSGPELFRYIFGIWLPGSEYTLDHRPHFEILGEKYKNDDPESEEEIWIPIKDKKAKR